MESAELAEEGRVVLVNRLAAMGERIWVNSTALKAHGFSAFEPLQDLVCTFSSETQIALHKQLLAERVKEIIGSQGPRMERRFRSALLENLRSRSPARSDDDIVFISTPCEDDFRSTAEVAFEDVQLARINAHRLARERLAAEAIILDRSNYQFSTASTDEVFKHGSAQVIEEFRSLGFLKVISEKRRMITLAKDINTDWELRLLADLSQGSIRKSAIVGSDLRPGSIVLSCFFCRATSDMSPILPRPHYFSPRQQVQIAYKECVPEFSDAYRYFYDAAQLRTIIRAHRDLLGQEIGFILRCIEDTLSIFEES